MNEDNIQPSKAHNTRARYGSVERYFHWTTAFLIITAAGLGLLAGKLGYDTDAELSRKAFVYSLHKTVGVTLFFVALGRIIWAMLQTRPHPLHAERKGEDMLASIVHWGLYGALVIVPLLGWSYHATTVGFAPILWPFGQGLPFIPKDPALGAVLSSLHKLAVITLFSALALHIIGTIKHVFIDRDLTLARMWRGAEPEHALSESQFPAILQVAVAALIWAAIMTLGVIRAPDLNNPTPAQTSTSGSATEENGNWRVEGGTLGLTVTQQGQSVSGEFKDWSAAINFDETPDANGQYGTIRAVIPTKSIQLGSVTADAKGGEFLAVDQFSIAVFNAVITASDELQTYRADGDLTLRGQSVPVSFPFALSLTGDTAEARAELTLDRRDFGMGPSYLDESNVGFSVTLNIELTASRSAATP